MRGLHLPAGRAVRVGGAGESRDSPDMASLLCCNYLYNWTGLADVKAHNLLNIAERRSDSEIYKYAPVAHAAR